MRRFVVTLLLLGFVYTVSYAIRIDKASLKTAYTAKSKGNVDFIAYNKLDGKGFVILDCNDNVLGYSDSGSFDYDKIPDNLKWWLSQYQEQIEWSRSQGIATSLNDSTEEDTIIVAPLVQSSWNQEPPYNNMCPTYYGRRSVVGCAATAMSQIMYFWKWPIRGHGGHEYTYNGKKISSDFSKHNYDWDNILPSYSDSSTTVQKKAVAQLCYDAGVSLDMQYSPDGSGAYSSALPTALQAYFSYASTTKQVKRTMFSSKWDSLIISELDQGRPIIYNGIDTDGAGGHAFICDGYSKNNYFHINWGWAGLGDGYFKTAALNVRTYKFNNNQDIIIGIQPRETFSYDGGCYITRSDSTVFLTYPDDYDYSGDMTIPYSFVKDSVTYKVIGISSGTFYSCDSLTSVFVPWLTPPSIVKGMFNDSCFDKTILIVPEGAILSYANVSEWMKFSNFLDTAGDSLKWKPWQTILDGTGTYRYNVNPLYTSGLFGAVDKGLPVTFRDCETDSINRQFWIKHWSYDTDFFINCDKSDNSCRVPMQSIGFSDNIGTEIWVSDVPTYDANKTYAEYSNTFNPQQYKFTFNLAYYSDTSSFGIGTETFQFDGIADSTLTARYDYDKTFGRRVGVYIYYGNCIDNCRYTFIEGELPQDSVIAIANRIASKQIDSKTAYKGIGQYLTPDVNKTYTMVIAGLDKSSDLVNKTSVIVNYNEIYDMIPGDANADKIIDVADITSIASFILGAKPKYFNRFSADVNNDGTIDVADITETADMILHQ